MKEEVRDPVKQQTAADKAEQDLVEFIATFAHDPLGFVLAVFPWGEPGTALEKHAGPRQWQREILEEIGEHLRNGVAARDAVDKVLAKMPRPYRGATASGHGIGKSALVSFLILWAISTCENTRGVVTANTEKQLTTKTWPEVMKWYGLMLNRHWFTAEATSIHAVGTMDVQKAWRIDAVPWSAENTEAFAGLHNQGSRILLIFDEASAIHDKVWEVAEGALTDEDTEIIWCAFGNPTRNSGMFRECFRKYARQWKTRQIDSRTVEGTNKAELDEQVQIHGENSDRVKVRIRGMFPATSAKQFIATEDVDEAYGRHLREDQYSFAPVIITCDPSWTGEDSLIIAKRQGLAFWILREMPKNDNDTHVATILAMLQDEHKADAVFIDAGYGTGIYSAGTSMGRQGWRLVWFGAKAPDPGFVNMRAWIWNEGKKWLKEGGAIPKDQGLYDELVGPETIERIDGKVQLESKKDMKERGLPSPNKADALMISFAFPVTSQKLLRGGVASVRQAILPTSANGYSPLRRR